MDANRSDNAFVSEVRDNTGTVGACGGSTNAPSSLSSFSSRLRQPTELLSNEFATVKVDGEESFSANPAVQAFVNKVPLLSLDEALEQVTLPTKEIPVVVADLSSSSGPNSVRNVALIVDKLRRRVSKDAEFQAYFNDLPSNDFNYLFQLLSNDGTGAKNVYAAGVPGSFFDRLFGQSSVHVFHSSNCLLLLSKSWANVVVHLRSLKEDWLGEESCTGCFYLGRKKNFVHLLPIPDEVLDSNDPAYNRGSTWILHSRSAVAKSYQRQASLDLKNFLLTRAVELVSGGLLFFFTVGRSTSETNESTNDFLGKSSADLDVIFRDLVAEGLLPERKHETFNIPCYERSMEDLREAIAYCGAFFDVLTLEMHRFDLTYGEIFETPEITAFPRRYVAAFKAVIGNPLEAHVGQELSDVIWQRLEKLVEKKIRATPVEDLKMTNSILLVSLIRK